MTRKDAAQLGKGLAFLSPWIVGFSVFMALPLILSFYYSLCDYALLKKPLYVGLDNYRQLIWQRNPTGQRGDPVFWQSLWNTIRYALMAVPSALLLSLGLALMLNAKIKGLAIYRTIIFLPALVPTVASAMVWMWMFIADYKQGLINSLLHRAKVPELLSFLHIIDKPTLPGWLSDVSWAMPALAMMSLWGVGYTVVIFVAGLQDVPVDLHEAAEIDGAGPLRRLWHVTIPMLSPVIFFNLIMAIIGTLQNFAVPYIMSNGKGDPVHSTYFYTMYIFDNAFMYLKMGYASAMAWMLFLIILALTGIAFWSSKHWVHYQGK